MLKQTVLNLMRVTGVFTPFRLANRAKVLILTYHRFSPTEEPDKTSAQAFADHLDYLTQHYRLLPLSEIADCLGTGRSLPPGAAALTVDDGYRDFYEVAFPLLLKYRAPATLFVATDFIDNRAWLWTDKLRFLTARTPANELVAVLKGRTLRLTLTDHLSRLKAADKINAILKTLPNEQKEEAIRRIAASLNVLLPPLPPPEFSAINWRQAREMDTEGIEIGSHTVTHPILPNVPDDEMLRHELTASKARLEEMLKRKAPLFCYPNGKSDARVQRATASAGYRCAVTNLPGLNTNQTPLLALRRIAPQPDLAHFVQSTSGFELWRHGLDKPKSAAVGNALPTAALATGPQNRAGQAGQVGHPR
jgi:peptidoglycan/xylan/chitin deacetylase (PgdA/CDA1 family)